MTEFKGSLNIHNTLEKECKSKVFFKWRALEQKQLANECLNHSEQLVGKDIMHTFINETREEDELLILQVYRRSISAHTLKVQALFHV